MNRARLSKDLNRAIAARKRLTTFPSPVLAQLRDEKTSLSPILQEARELSEAARPYRELLELARSLSMTPAVSKNAEEHREEFQYTAENKGADFSDVELAFSEPAFVESVSSNDVVGNTFPSGAQISKSSRTSTTEASKPEPEESLSKESDISTPFASLLSERISLTQDFIAQRLAEGKTSFFSADTLSDPSPRQLIEYSPATGEKGHENLHAIIAIGDMDTARRIAIFVPGMGSDVKTSSARYTGDMISFLQASRSRTSDSLASVVFLGYDAPARPFPLNTSLDYSVFYPEKAELGASYLSSFLEEIAHERKGEQRPLITLLLHSYGSVVGVKTLVTLPEGIVDNVILFGSPGLVAESADDLSIPAGHLYSLLYESDAVGILADRLRPYGIGHGTSVTSSAGVISLEPGSPAHSAPFSARAHSDYIAKGSDSFETMVSIFTGNTPDNFPQPQSSN